MRVAEGDETLLPFVPQDQSHTAETLQQGQPPDALEVRVVIGQMDRMGRMIGHRARRERSNEEALHKLNELHQLHE